MDYVGIITASLGGLGLFIYGMHVMASGLQKAAGNKMKRILEIITKNKFLGIVVGAIVTAIIQSSSATTVMVVGFVNAGIMSLAQSVGIIMGANIGTTATGWIVSSVSWASFLEPTTVAPIAVALGAALVLFAKKNSIKQIGEIIVGFGLLFIGISMLSEGVAPLSSLPAFKEAFILFGKNPILGVLVGAAVTAIIQSSSASVGILQSLALTGVVSWNSAIYIIMGQNIGTCVTALLSSIGASKNARGAAYIHLLFNVLGSILFSILAFIFFTFINQELGFKEISIVEISIVHTVFNIANTVIMYPFSGLLVKIAEKLTSKEKAQTTKSESSPVHLDDRILETPGIAIQNCIKEIVRLGYMALENLQLATQCLLEKDEEKAETVLAREKNIDKLQQMLTEYMVKLCNADISENENNMITSLFHTVNDLERIGDHCENIIELSNFMEQEQIAFSNVAKKEIVNISNLTVECVENSVKALEDGDKKYAIEASRGEAEVDEMEQNLRILHIKRLKDNECDPTTGVVFLDVLTNLERVTDHALNVAQGVVSRIEKKTISQIKEELKSK